MSITLADIEAARRVIAGAVLRTPMLPAPRLSALTGAEVYVKYENLQVTNSFKDRGALNKLAALERGRTRARRHRHVGRQPRPVGRLSRRPARHSGDHRHAGDHALREGGGDRARTAPRWCCTARPSPSARPFASASGTSAGSRLVHPYDDARIIAGQGTIALEMLEEVGELDCLVIPIGGGGLISGNAIAARAVKPPIEIVGVEAALYPSMVNALHGGAAPPAARRWPKASRSNR